MGQSHASRRYTDNTRFLLIRCIDYTHWILPALLGKHCNTTHTSFLLLCIAWCHAWYYDNKPNRFLVLGLECHGQRVTCNFPAKKKKNLYFGGLFFKVPSFIIRFQKIYKFYSEQFYGTVIRERTQCCIKYIIFSRI